MLCSSFFFIKTSEILWGNTSKPARRLLFGAVNE